MILYLSEKNCAKMLRYILDQINEFGFVQMLFFMQAAQACTALPFRYRRLGLELATAFKKITLATGFRGRKIWESTTFMA